MQISPNLHFQVIFQVDLRWPLTLICDILTTWTYEGSHIISINQDWFKLDFQLFKWGHFHIFSLSYNLTKDDFWPWNMTFDCMNIWKFPYYTLEAKSLKRDPALMMLKYTIGKALGAMQNLNDIWKSKDISTSTKIQLYKTLILSLLMYGSKTWTLKKRKMKTDC